MPAHTEPEKKKKRSTRGFFKALKGRSKKVARKAIKARFGSAHKDENTGHKSGHKDRKKVLSDSPFK